MSYVIMLFSKDALWRLSSVGQFGQIIKKRMENNKHNKHLPPPSSIVTACQLHVLDVVLEIW